MGGTEQLRNYWGILRRRRWIAALGLASVTLVTLVGSLLGTPQYRATATLQIERTNPEIYTFRDMSQLDSSWAAYADFYQTQYTLLASEVVARKAVARLGLDSHPLFVADAPDEPSLVARLKALVPRRPTPVAPPDPAELAAGRILAGLEITPLRNSRLVRVAWISEDPQLAANVANAVADAYIQFNIESQFTATEQAGEFLVNQIGKVTREIDEAERLLQQYGESKNIVSIDEATNVTLQGMHDIAGQRVQAQTALALAGAALDAALAATPDSLPEVMNSSLVARLREEHARYEAAYSEQSRQFKDDWPGLQTLRSKVEQARARLELETARIVQQVRTSAGARRDKAEQEVRNLELLLARHEQAAQRMRKDAVEYANLLSVVTKKREALDELIRRQNEMALSTELKELETTSTNARVVERAKPPRAPFRPRTGLNVALGLLVGALLGIAAAFGLDGLDNTVGTAAALESLVGLPTLALVPHHGPAGVVRGRTRRRTGPAGCESFDLLPFLDVHARASEAYRELRTAILLSHPGEPPRKIALTSSLPEEGKSATALNLSVVLAQLGRRVVVVDTDLRRPRLHVALGLANARGVSTFLSGLEPEPARLVVPTRIEALAALPSGPVPPNPSELLNSERFASLGERLLAQGFDHVIFDSPPVLSVSDPVLVAATADITILVVRAGRTPRNAIRQAVAKLQPSTIRVAGVVLNHFEAELDGSHYGQGYYARYYRASEESEPQGDPPRAAGAGA